MKVPLFAVHIQGEKIKFEYQYELNYFLKKNCAVSDVSATVAPAWLIIGGHRICVLTLPLKKNL